jgi:hypothetical protein
MVLTTAYLESGETATNDYLDNLCEAGYYCEQGTDDINND